MSKEQINHKDTESQSPDDGQAALLRFDIETLRKMAPGTVLRRHREVMFIRLYWSAREFTKGPLWLQVKYCAKGPSVRTVRTRCVAGNCFSHVGLPLPLTSPRLSQCPVCDTMLCGCGVQDQFYAGTLESKSSGNAPGGDEDGATEVAS
ncbi:hypothetical protein IT575_12120 [bacterium]|nr:hypothetical protein [bacterium]